MLSVMLGQIGRFSKFHSRRSLDHPGSIIVRSLKLILFLVGTFALTVPTFLSSSYYFFTINLVSHSSSLLTLTVPMREVSCVGYTLRARQHGIPVPYSLC